MRIAIAHPDSQLRQQLARHLGDMDLAWESGDMATTLERLAADPPQVLLMGIRLDNRAGIRKHLQAMVQRHALPVLMLVSSMETEADIIFEALGAGAADAVALNLENGGVNPNDLQQLGAKLRNLGLLHTGLKFRPRQATPAVASGLPPLIAMGASTGGPSVLADILTGLPAELPASLVIVQHVDAEFSQGLAEWLDSQTPLAVRLARSGDRPLPGHVHLASSHEHLVINPAGGFQYTPHPADYVYRPSVNVFFDSVARNWRGPVAAVLLTGMGRDGAEGMALLHRKGILTLAQDAASCAVYGMPRAAIESGVVQAVDDPQGLRARLLEFVSLHDDGAARQSAAGGGWQT